MDSKKQRSKIDFQLLLIENDLEDRNKNYNETEKLIQEKRFLIDYSRNQAPWKNLLQFYKRFK